MSKNGRYLKKTTWEQGRFHLAVIIIKCEEEKSWLGKLSISSYCHYQRLQILDLMASGDRLGEGNVLFDQFKSSLSLIQQRDDKILPGL